MPHRRGRHCHARISRSAIALSPEAVKVASFLAYHSDSEYRVGTCFISSGYTFQNFAPAACLKQDAARKNYLLIGDSHAAQLWYGLSTIFPGVNVMQATASGCKPTLAQSSTSEDRCRQLMDYIFTDYLPAHHVDALLIAGRWREDDLPRLAETMAWAKQRGLNVILFGPMLQYDAALPRLLATSITNNSPQTPYDHRVIQYVRPGSANVRSCGREVGRALHLLFKTLCGPASCVEFADDGVPLQADYGHLTKDGSVLLAQRLRQSQELP